MRTDRNIAFKLRLSGKSYSEIQKTLSVPKSTLSGWFSGLVLSVEKREALAKRAHKKSIAGLLKRNRNQTFLARQRAEFIRQEAAKEIRNFDSNDLLLSGAMLYWAEGYKRVKVVYGREVTNHPVSLTNSDPLLVRLFLRFLREYCLVPNEKIKAGVRIFPHQNEQEILKYWREVTKILPQNFGKVYRGISKSSQGKRPYNQLVHGVIQVVVADTKLFHRIMGYIEGFKKLV